MKVQVLGSGCPTCKKWYEMTKEAVQQLELQVKVEYITDVSKIIEMGVMSSPVLAINGKPAMVGSVPDMEKLKKLLASACSIKLSSASRACKGDCTCKGNC